MTGRATDLDPLGLDPEMSDMMHSYVRGRDKEGASMSRVLTRELEWRLSEDFAYRRRF